MTRLVYAEKEEESEKWFNLCIFILLIISCRLQRQLL
jgi:hypothetical protein